MTCTAALRIGSLRQRFASDNEAIFIHISNFRPVKRIEDVIAVFARVRHECPAKLLLVGDGPERPKAEWLAETQGVSQDVLFVGKQSDMAPFLSIADILLLPSENESFGLVALEAMACEVPVIATRIGGTSRSRRTRGGRFSAAPWGRSGNG